MQDNIGLVEQIEVYTEVQKYWLNHRLWL